MCLYTRGARWVRERSPLLTESLCVRCVHVTITISVSWKFQGGDKVRTENGLEEWRPTQLDLVYPHECPYTSHHYFAVLPTPPNFSYFEMWLYSPTIIIVRNIINFLPPHTHPGFDRSTEVLKSVSVLFSSNGIQTVVHPKVNNFDP